MFVLITGAKYCYQPVYVFVGLFVCLSARVSQKQHVKIFCTCSRLGLPLTAESRTTLRMIELAM